MILTTFRKEARAEPSEKIKGLWLVTSSELEGKTVRSLHKRVIRQKKIRGFKTWRGQHPIVCGQAEGGKVEVEKEKKRPKTRGRGKRSSAPIG